MKQNFIRRMNKEIKEQLTRFTFRPDGPAGTFQWLTTLHINDVMDQYHNKYDDFLFLGAVPMDFDNLKYLGLRNINLEELYDEGKKQIGIVFNLDDHDEPGSHWVGMYSNLEKGQIYYFDSYGIKPEKRVRKFMNRINKYMKNKKMKNIDVQYNKKRHQYGHSECGVYSLNFILRILNGTSFDDLTTNKTTDSEVAKCRNVYFISDKK